MDHWSGAACRCWFLHSLTDSGATTGRESEGSRVKKFDWLRRHGLVLRTPKEYPLLRQWPASDLPFEALIHSDVGAADAIERPSKGTVHEVGHNGGTTRRS
jgi:hypothetical protein